MTGLSPGAHTHMQLLDPILPTFLPGKGLRVSIASASSPAVHLQLTTNPCFIRCVVANSRGSRRHQADPESQACLVPSIMPLLNHRTSFISSLCPEQKKESTLILCVPRFRQATQTATGDLLLPELLKSALGWAASNSPSVAACWSTDQVDHQEKKGRGLNGTWSDPVLIPPLPLSMPTCPPDLFVLFTLSL